MTDLKMREVVSTGHRVVHKGAAQQLSTLRVVDTILHQSLANALNQTAMDLPLHNHGIDDRSKIINGGETIHFDHPRLRIDFDLANVGSCRKCEIGGVVKGRLIEPRLQFIQGIVVRQRLRFRYFFWYSFESLLNYTDSFT